jgi:hypothetical protein
MMDPDVTMSREEAAEFLASLKKLRRPCAGAVEIFRHAQNLEGNFGRTGSRSAPLPHSERAVGGRSGERRRSGSALRRMAGSVPV